VPLLAAAALATSAASAQDGGTPAAPAAPAPTAPQAAAPAPAGTTGGYSWRDKPRRKRKKKAAPRIDPDKPLATYPGFALQPDGTSKIWLSVNKKVPVEVRKAAGRIVFVLRQVQIGVRNNSNPLVTTHFPTAVASARLVPSKVGAELVVELRDRVQPSHRVTDGPSGSMLLEITVPRPTRSFPDVTTTPPSSPGAGKVVLPSSRRSNAPSGERSSGPSSDRSTRGPRP
jgi:hypothetical protein